MPRSPRPATVLAISLLSAGLPGCQGTPYAEKSAATSNLNHVVLISLSDPAEAARCAEDCRALLADIDAVETIWVGTPVDTGRAAVDADYEVGLCVGFETREALQAYLEDPRHLELVEIWRPRAAGFRIFDVGSPDLDR